MLFIFMPFFFCYLVYLTNNKDLGLLYIGEGVNLPTSSIYNQGKQEEVKLHNLECKEEEGGRGENTNPVTHVAGWYGTEVEVCSR